MAANLSRPHCVNLKLCNDIKQIHYLQSSGLIFTKKTPSYGYGNPHYKPKTVWWPSQVYNGNPYTNKTASSQWIETHHPFHMVWIKLQGMINSIEAGSTVCTVYPKKYAHGFVVLCFVVVMQSFIMNSHEVFIHIQQGCFAGTGAIVRLPQCQWSKPDGYGKIIQGITTTKHS